MSSLSGIPVWWVTQPSSHILSPRLKLPRQHRVLCWCLMQKHPLPLCMGRVMVPQCSLYHLDRASSPPRLESSWVLRRDGEKTPGSRFVKLPCVIHSLTSFTCCDSFSFWGCRHSYSTRVWFSRCITSSGAGASPHALYMTSGVWLSQIYDGLQ